MKLLKIVTAGVFLYLSMQAKGAEFCVSNVAALKAALTGAESNNQDDVIKITSGIFDTDGAAFSYDAVNNWDLEISGGWSPVINNLCGIQSGNATVLDGQTANRVLEFAMFGNASLTVSDLTIINGLTGDSGGGVLITRFNDLNQGRVTIERNMFINNGSVLSASALSVSNANSIRVKNNFFGANQTGGKYTVHVIQQDPGYGVYFINNTVVFNDASVAMGDAAGVRLSVPGGNGALVANNIMIENGNEDLFLFGSADFYVKHNNVGVVNGATPLESFGNISLPPRFESGILNYTPSATSPLVNAGITPCFVCPDPVPFDQTWQIGDVDLGGDTRVQNVRVDIGAYESPHVRDLIFWDIFE